MLWVKHNFGGQTRESVDRCSMLEVKERCAPANKNFGGSFVQPFEFVRYPIGVAKSEISVPEGMLNLFDRPK